MWHAIEKYDPTRGPFGPYASMRMTHVLISLIKSARKKLHNRDSIMPINADGSIDVNVLPDGYTVEGGRCSLPVTHGEVLDAQEIVNDLEPIETSVDLDRLLDGAPERWARILRRRIAYDTCKTIANDEGVSAQRVQQLSAKALRYVHKKQEQDSGRSEERPRETRIPPYPDGVSGRSS